MKRALEWNSCAVIVAAAVVTVYFHGAADAIWRSPYLVSRMQHYGLAWVLYTAIGGLVGVGLWVLGLVERVVSRRLGGKLGLAPASAWLRSAVYGAQAAIFSYPTATWTFSGAGVSQTAFGWFGPPLFLALVFVGASVFARLVLTVLALPGLLPRVGLLLSAVLVGSALVSIDQHLFVALYDRLHSYIEITALFLLFFGWFTIFDALAQSKLRFVFRGVLVSSLLMASVLVLSVRARDRLDEAMTHAWVDPVYIGRMLRRAEELEVYLSAPTAYDGIQMGRLGRLKTRYQLTDVALAKTWVRPPPEPSELGHAETSLRKAPNVLVFYIDTLRYDVAHDPSIMPNLARFRGQSLDYTKAYATGSDTLRSLPGITGGNYFVRNVHDGDLCELGAASGHESSLFIAKSAREFLERLRPEFKFKHEVQVPDYPNGRDVWGYGADQPTSGKIVDAALDHLKRHKREKFFMWLFHFDQHNWRELEEAYVNRVIQEHKVPFEGALNNRYRAVASAIDAEFGRLLRGLDELGLSDDTVVLMLSDHGEGLGEGGFWVHSVFLWESLIHVPLALRVPGVPPKVVHAPVSLVDVAPTLANFLGLSARQYTYHGEDLVAQAAEVPVPRRFPILFGAALRDELVRIGMLDETGTKKLVVRLEAAQLEFHDLLRPLPDDTNVAHQYPKQSRDMLRRLAKSPLFPRDVHDFRMLEPKGRLPSPDESGVLPVSAGHTHE